MRILRQQHARFRRTKLYRQPEPWQDRVSASDRIHTGACAESNRGTLWHRRLTLSVASDVGAGPRSPAYEGGNPFEIGKNLRLALDTEAPAVALVDCAFLDRALDRFPLVARFHRAEVLGLFSECVDVIYPNLTTVPFQSIKTHARAKEGKSGTENH
jgi:hypothetical protein